MILLSDNDLVVKLAQCDLIDTALYCLGAARQDCYVLDTMKYSLKLNDPEKSIQRYVGSAKTYERISELLQECRELPAAPLDSTLLDHMYQIPQIDPGEFALFLHAEEKSKAAAAYKVLTGDKRALRAICAYEDFNHFEFLCSQICCLESCMIDLIKSVGYESVNSCVISARQDVLPSKFDSVLRTAFGAERSEDHCVDCLHQYFSDISRLFPSYF